MITAKNKGECFQGAGKTNPFESNTQRKNRLSHAQGTSPAHETDGVHLPVIRNSNIHKSTVQTLPGNVLLEIFDRHLSLGYDHVHHIADADQPLDLAVFKHRKMTDMLHIHQ